MNNDINKDKADQIRELAALGYGRNKIAAMCDTNASAVRMVLEGKRVNFADDLTTRQRQALLNHAFRP